MVRPSSGGVNRAACSNLGALSSDIIIVRGIDLEMDMTLFSPTVLYPPIAMHGRLDSSDIAFAVWASIVLIAMAMLSVAVGATPIVDPQICTGC